ncbi:MAG: D-glycero-beta-D-manno-heptose 1,7-bisphosphate 7-phosphatase [Pseudomonas sp.]|jgi:D-glycero-D-manno-heptose 1,7-bisphosphate phosphatase|nr:D-glycero-beta-D-manno-heptose 1,7-bisphosphate 7-phosphatase [Pseudomonas sp.]
MKLLILDRDGVINYDSDDYIKNVDEWIALPGALDAIARLSCAGWTVAVATNQSGLARGYYSVSTLESIHQVLRAQVQQRGGHLGLIRYCPHGPDDGCSCRKPLPGLLLQIAEHYKTTLDGVWFVGDSLRDLQAAAAVNAQPVLVCTGKGEQTREQPLPDNTLIFADLSAVADHLLR